MGCIVVSSETTYLTVAMEQTVGIRVLKARAGELVRNVQRGRRYVISIRGRPVALLIPIEPVMPPPAENAWEELFHLGESLRWSTERTTQELLAEVRR